MSDQSQGPGWWLASDGKWYPPQSPPPYQPAPYRPPVGPSSKKSGCSSAALLGGLLVVLLLLFVAIGIAGSNNDKNTKTVTNSPEQTSPEVLSSGGTATTAASTEAAPSTPPGPAACKDTPPDVSLDTQHVGLYPNRPDIQTGNDHEAALGDCVRIQGLTAYVTSAKNSQTSYSKQLVEIQATILQRSTGSSRSTPMTSGYSTDRAKSSTHTSCSSRPTPNCPRYRSSKAAPPREPSTSMLPPATTT